MIWNRRYLIMCNCYFHSFSTYEKQLITLLQLWTLRRWRLLYWMISCRTGRSHGTRKRRRSFKNGWPVKIYWKLQRRWFWYISLKNPRPLLPLAFNPSSACWRPHIKLGSFLDVKAFMKKKAVGYRHKKSKIFGIDQWTTFIREADDKCHLLYKVIVILGIAGAMRKIEIFKQRDAY